jgi:hypothetical protein
MTGYQGRTPYPNMAPPPSVNRNPMPPPQAGSAYPALDPHITQPDSTNAPLPSDNGSQERRKSGQRTKSITGFPGYPARDVLPPDDLSCYGICQQFPACLQYEMLRPFIQRRWSAEEIFSSLRPDVQQYIMGRNVGQELGFLHKRLQSESQLLKSRLSADGTSNDFIKLLNATRVRTDGRPERLRNGQSIAAPPEPWRRRHGAGIDPLTGRYVMIRPGADPRRPDIRPLLRSEPNELALNGPLPPNSRASSTNTTTPAPVAPPMPNAFAQMLLGVQPSSSIQHHPPGNQAPRPLQSSTLGKRRAPSAFDDDALPAKRRSAPGTGRIAAVNKVAPGEEWESSMVGQTTILRSLQANRGAANVPPPPPPQAPPRFSYPDEGLGVVSSASTHVDTMIPPPFVPDHPIWAQANLQPFLSSPPLPPQRLQAAGGQGMVVRGSSVTWNGFSDDPMGEIMGSGEGGEWVGVEEGGE